MLLRRIKDDVISRMRRRLIRETEAALLYGLLFPDRSPRIPTVQVGHGKFHPAYAARWWCEVLDIKPESYSEAERGPANDAILPEFRRY